MSIQTKLPSWNIPLPKLTTTGEFIVKPRVENSFYQDSASTSRTSYSHRPKKFILYDEVNLTGGEIFSLDCNKRLKRDLLFKNDLRTYFKDFLGFESEPRLLLLEKNADDYSEYNQALKEGYMERRPKIEAEFAGHFIGKSAFKWSEPFHVLDGFWYEGLVSDNSRYLLEVKGGLYSRGNRELNGLMYELSRARKHEKKSIEKEIDRLKKDLVGAQARSLAYKVNRFARNVEEDLPVKVVYILRECDVEEEKEYIDLFLEAFLNGVYVDELKSITFVQCDPEHLKETLLEKYKVKSERVK